MKNRTAKEPAGEVTVSVTDSDGGALVAEVKLFAVAADVGTETFTYADFCPDFVRAYTGENGIFTE